MTIIWKNALFFNQNRKWIIWSPSINICPLKLIFNPQASHLYANLILRYSFYYNKNSLKKQKAIHLHTSYIFLVRVRIKQDESFVSYKDTIVLQPLFGYDIQLFLFRYDAWIQEKVSSQFWFGASSYDKPSVENTLLLILTFLDHLSSRLYCLPSTKLKLVLY